MSVAPAEMPLHLLFLESMINGLSAPEEEEKEPEMPLLQFVREGWHVIEPTTPYTHGWHIEAISEHLTAVAQNEIRHLIINMPPRHMKSITVSVMWPAWMWTFRPSFRWLFSSYSAGLSIRDSVRSRRLITSPWYQGLFGGAFRLTGDQNAKARYENDKTGYRISTSVGGAATGEGGDGVVVDDPHNVIEADSEARREASIEWWDLAMSTRLNNPATGHKLVIMQRVHEKDLTGHLKEMGGYEILTLPAEYVPSTYVSGIGWADPREKPGDLLWPERVGPEQIADAKKSLGSYGYSSQYQQDPVPPGAALFKRAWWGFYKGRPKLERVEQYIDSAFKEAESNDPSVIATWGIDGIGSYFLLDLWLDRVAYPELLRAIHIQHQRWRHAAPVVPIIIEDKGSGQSALQTLRRPMPTVEGILLPRLPVIPFPAPDSPIEKALAKMSKYERAESVTPLVQSGSVYLPFDAQWLEDFIFQHEKFPRGSHDDIVDTTSMALTRLPRIMASLVRKQQQVAATDAPTVAGQGWQAPQRGVAPAQPLSHLGLPE